MDVFEYFRVGLGRSPLGAHAIKTITYTPSGGSPRSITARVSYRDLTLEQADGGTRRVQIADLVVDAKDDTNGVITVQPQKDQASFPAVEGGDNVDWVIVDAEGPVAGEWRMTAHDAAAYEHHREGFFRTD